MTPYLTGGYTVSETVDYAFCYRWLFVIKYCPLLTNIIIPKDIIRLISKTCIIRHHSHYVPGERDRF